MTDDSAYWNDYYKGRNAVGFPSPFAEFCQEHLLADAANVVELGSGNGRDSFYFYDQGHQVRAFDMSQEAVDACQQRAEGVRHPARLSFTQGDFSHLDPDDFDGIDTIYSRFTLHSIDDEAEERVLDWAAAILPAGGQFLIEARTILDPLYGKGTALGNHAFHTDHYRRHLDAQAFLGRVLERGFQLRFFQESDGLAEFQGEDPVVLRLAVVAPGAVTDRRSGEDRRQSSGD